jgi:hypothetical protein
MVNRSLAISIGILILVSFGLFFMSNIAGNVITGSAAVESVDDEEYFRISDFGAGDEAAPGIEVGDGA